MNLPIEISELSISVIDNLLRMISYRYRDSSRLLVIHSIDNLPSILQTTGLLKFQGREIEKVKRGGPVTEISCRIILDRDCRIRVSN